MERQTDLSVIRQLGDGLVMCRSTLEDAQALSEFNAAVHSDQGLEKPDPRLYAWTHDLISKPHPTFDPADFTLVVDTGSGRIVSSLNLISQTWSYAGIPFKVGRIELVGTLPAYRERGLVRAQFEEVHRWSAERGELVQGITGIPYYYRQFGYEMALNLGGGRAGFSAHVPQLNEGETEPFPIRPAAPADLPLIAGLYQQNCQRLLVASQRDMDTWHYELEGKSSENVNRMELHVITDQAGSPLGFLAVPWFTWGTRMVATWYELKQGISYAQVTPSVIRFLRSAYQTHPDYEVAEKRPFESFGFWFGEDHPAYHVFPDRLPYKRPCYAWYLRLVDVPGFLRHIAPLLEQRLAESPLVGHSGEMRLTFYRQGVRLVFEKGCLVTSEVWKPTPVGHTGEAAFPGLTFLQLLFGYRSLEELKYAFADCWTASDSNHMLLATLFPRQPSQVWPID